MANPESPTMAIPKIIVAGGVDGKLQSFFSKLSKLHTQHSFSFAIVVGNLFAVAEDDSLTDLLAGKVQVPVTTYFTVGTHALPARIVDKITNDESEICPNLHYLNKSSITKTSEGVRLVTLGGILDAEILGGSQSKEQHLPYHTPADAKALRGANSADILLTAVWPSLIWKGSSLALPFDIDVVPTSSEVADLCAHLKPRYHFCPSPGTFAFEREPFFHTPSNSSTDRAVTRFVSLAPFGNKEKAKAIHAFEIKAPGLVPAGSTVSPFLALSNMSKKRSTPDDTGFSRFGNDHYDGGRPRNRRRGAGRQRLPPPGPDTCFFCLGRDNAESHMVCSVGDEAYVATAKGPLTTSATFAKYGLDYPAHMIMTPQAHISSIAHSVMGREAAEKTFEEMARLREAMQAAVSKCSKQKLGAVTWEINRAAAGHVHWQFLPTPADLVERGLVEAAFKVEADNLKLPSLEVKDFGLADDIPGDFVRIWIWYEDDGDDGGKIVSTCLLMRFDDNVEFDLQYPRKVMAKLLGLEDRIFWRKCIQTPEDEERDTNKFQEAFKPWDFTLDG